MMTDDERYAHNTNDENLFVITQEGHHSGKWIVHERGPNRPNKIARFENQLEALELARRAGGIAKAAQQQAAADERARIVGNLRARRDVCAFHSPNWWLFDEAVQMVNQS